MTGLKYQLKNSRRDKMCMLAFILPVLVGIAIHLLSGVSFQAMEETAFGIIENNMSDDAVKWLRSNGAVSEFDTRAALEAAVNDPSTQMIGVLPAGEGIQTIISGDELEVNQVIAETLPELYNNRNAALTFSSTILSPTTDNEGLKSLLIAMTLVTAMFMGCTFNAMNIIGEKEEGIGLVNQILPVSMVAFVSQKILLGFLGGTASSLMTAMICMKIAREQLAPFLLIVLLSAYISALAGLFIGHYANELMVGIGYIKIVMVIFLAPPIFFYLTVPHDSFIFRLSYLLPSSATFYGVMDVLNGRRVDMILTMGILLIHAVFWSLAYGCIRKIRQTDV